MLLYYVYNDGLGKILRAAELDKLVTFLLPIQNGDFNGSNDIGHLKHVLPSQGCMTHVTSLLLLVSFGYKSINKVFYNV